MNLAHWFQRISLIEFSNLELGQSGDGSIDIEDVRKVVTLMNEGLLTLYTQFNLSEKVILLEQIAHRTEYPLIPMHAVSQYVSGSGIDAFIKDTPANPFTGDILKILDVISETLIRIPIGEDKDPKSLYLPQYDVLRIPEPMDGEVLSIHYQAKHPELLVPDTLSLFDANQEVHLPEVLHIAFRAYIAHRLYGAMNTEVSVGRSVDHFRTFQEECERAFKDNNVHSSKTNTPDKFTARGWA